MSPGTVSAMLPTVTVAYVAPAGHRSEFLFFFFKGLGLINALLSFMRRVYPLFRTEKLQLVSDTLDLSVCFLFVF